MKDLTYESETYDIAHHLSSRRVGTMSICQDVVDLILHKDAVKRLNLSLMSKIDADSEQ